ncbi:LPS assembly lipoprotein LptE [Pseudoroseicyclus aestuarii]|uniref:LPS-assembly lipoprotein n=1 Tax=Pseudoroseicyclus aestuarii TaxID=1795041 RepID=A0A318T5N4_9RHOB|nr:LPS assembly lipoprotein LptE [Pseudoroseicyclus aestuarii]PYE83668.1 LPS-assembly lipoprotein [Pseudoroseicyclus aestuarii]
MSSSRALILAAALVAGCGFQPVLAPGGAGAALRGQTTVEVPADVLGYRLRQHMLDRLGRGEAARFALSIDSRSTIESGAVTGDNATTRYRLVGTADYVLRDAAGAVLAQGNVESFTGYSATGSTVASAAARTDAESRLAVALADLILARLYAAAPAS